MNNLNSSVFSGVFAIIAALCLGGTTANANGSGDDETEPYNSHHYCYTAASGDAVCTVLDGIENPDFDASEDLVVVPHRGYWGNDLGTGAPENSMSALEALATGTTAYSVTELDMMNTSDGGLIASHDYPLYRLTNDTGTDVYVFEKTQAELQELYLRRRNTEISADNMMSFSDAILYANGNDIILMIDAKEEIGKYENGVCIAYCGTSTEGCSDATADESPCYPDYEADKGKNWMKIVSNVLSSAEAGGIDNSDARKNVVIKTYLTPDEIINGASATDTDDGYDGIGDDTMGTVLWMPMIISDHFKDSDGNPDIQLMADFVDEWNSYASCNSGACNERVAAVETDFKDDDDAMLQSFTRTGDGTNSGMSYDNILDYIYQVMGKRAGIFTDEPSGPKGVVTRWSLWKMKDVTTDRRSDHLWVVTPNYAKYMAITTNSADTWTALKAILSDTDIH